jgi:hypothetical protein
MGCKARIVLYAGIIFLSIAPMMAQQKGQYLPGQFGLNAGYIPDAGITYANMAFNYSANNLNDSNGNHISRQYVSGTYSFWLDENIFYYVPKYKILGGYYLPYVAINAATGEVVADITGTDLSSGAGASGWTDTWVEPFNMGWHFGKRVDFTAGYAFMAPTGRYSPGATDNVGTGYWGNNITSGTTLYVTKNHATTLNLSTDWEIHGNKKVASTPSGQFSYITPGQAFTDEWGLGQIIPLKKDLSQLSQFGFVGYDQWQVTANGGNYLIGGTLVPASSTPYYSVHGMGIQASYIWYPKDFNLFFKYYNEYSAKSRPEGRTIVFGGSWTLRIPKPAAKKP